MDPREQIALIGRILGTALGRRPLGPSESLIEAGGDSLLAARALIALRRETGANISLDDFYHDPTPQGIDEFIRRSAPGAAPGSHSSPRSLPTPRRIDRAGDLPLTLRQAGILQRFGLDLPPWRNAVQTAFIVEGEIDHDRLEWAANEVVRRHEALRTHVRIEEGEFKQWLVEQAPRVVVRRFDLSTAADPALALVTFAGDHARQQFDLANGPLLRVTLARLGDSRSLLLVAIDHFLADGAALEIVLSELSAFVHGTDPGPDPELHLVDYAAWQQRIVAGAVREELAAYWRRTLGDAFPKLALPPDAEDAERAAEGATEERVLSRDAVEAADRLARLGGVTRFVVLAGAWGLILSEERDHAPVSVLAPYSARVQPGFERSVGDVSNAAPLLFALPPEVTFRRMLSLSREVCDGLLNCGMLPYDEIMRAVGGDDRKRPADLSEGFFGVEQIPSLDLPNATATLFETPVQRSYFDLSLFVLYQGEVVKLQALYKPALFSSGRIARMLERFERTLEHGAAEPDERASLQPAIR